MVPLRLERRYESIPRKFQNEIPFPSLFSKCVGVLLKKDKFWAEWKRDLKRIKKNEAKIGSCFFAQALEKKAKWITFRFILLRSENFSKRNRRSQIHKFISASYSKFYKGYKISIFFYFFTVLPVTVYRLFYLSRQRHRCQNFHYFGTVDWNFLEKVYGKFSFIFGWNRFGSGSESADPGCRSGFLKMMPITIT